ncbi:MAG: dnaK, partial [Candidatus Krumholzibacteriota bacterium]|nr:dnaK [Candidatus Krumholzibacteriota bacterium]
RGTGKEQKIVIKASSGLSEGEIDRMVKDADRLKDEDRKKRALVDAKNEADALAYQTEKSLKEHKDRLSADDKRRLEGRIEEIKNALKTEDTQTIKDATARLSTDWQDVAQRMYQTASGDQAHQPDGGGSTARPEPSQEQTTGPAGGDSKVVDADYEIIDDDSKK